jgi:hypothetical protein
MCNLDQSEVNSRFYEEAQGLLTTGLDNTRLFMSLTAGAGTRCMCILSSSPSLYGRDVRREEYHAS